LWDSNEFIGIKAGLSFFHSIQTSFTCVAATLLRRPEPTEVRSELTKFYTTAIDIPHSNRFPLYSCHELSVVSDKNLATLLLPFTNPEW